MKEEEIYNKLVQANKEYRQGTPIMSDQEYDNLVEELRSINPNHQWLQKVEPGMIIEGRKVKLPYPMKSLDKVKTFDELMGWLDTVVFPDEEIVLTPKYDGISLLCNESDLTTYSRGGSDNEGLDCSTHMRYVYRYFCGKNKRFSYTFGEAVISKHSWNTHFKGKINPLNGQEYKSARNTVAGLFRRDIPSEALLSHVDFIKYGAFGEEVNEYLRYDELLYRMSLGAGYTATYLKVCKKNLNEDMLKEFFNKCKELYDIDGIVLYVNDMVKWDMLGRHKSTGNPQYAIAYKPEYFTSSEITTVIDVNCKVSKSGALKPTVAIEAIELEGATITNPTGYNAKYCINNGIGKGAEVEVIRSGMVIPKIVTVVSPVSQSEAEESFKICPSCGSKTEWDKTNVERVCSNKSCPGILLAKLVYFCEKIGYDDIGEETIKAIFNKGVVTPGDLLHEDISTFINIDGIGYDTAMKIIETNRNIFDNGVSLYKLMEASDCFDGIGEKKAKLLLKNVEPNLIKKWLTNNLSYEEFKVIDSVIRTTKGVGSKMYQEFYDKNIHFVQWVIKNKIPVIIDGDSTSNKLEGQKICFTGVRDKKLEKWIEENGGNVVSSVSKNTSLLIVDSLSSSSSKATKAKNLGVKIMTLDSFMETYNV